MKHTSLSHAALVLGLWACCTPLVTAQDGVVYAEDFSNAAKALKGWKMKNPAFFTVSAEGRLASGAEKHVPIVGCSSPNFQATGDARIVFDFSLHDSKELQFKINYSGGGHICRFIIDETGFLLRVNTNRNIPITEAMDMEKVNARIAPEKWHTFVIEKKGRTITGSIEGIGSKSYQQDYFSHEIGSFGLSVKGTTALLDSISITALPKSTPTVKTTALIPAASDIAWTKPLQPFFEQHCYDCHDDTTAKGDLDLFTLSTDLADAETLRRWVRVFDRVESGDMPPAKKPRPAESDKVSFLTLLESPLIAGHQSQRETVLRRLNRAEYENTINDLFGIEIRLKDRFPQDAKKHGFDNNGEGLTLSSELIALYLEAANLALDRTLGPDTAPQRIKIDGHIQDYIHENMYHKWEKLIGDDKGTVIYSSEFGAGSQMNHLKLKEPGTYRVRFHAQAHQSEEPVMMQIQTGVQTRQGDKRFMGFFEIPASGRGVEFTDYMEPGESFYPRPFGTLKNISGFIGRNTGRTIHDYKGPGLRITRFELEGPIDEWPAPSRVRLLGKVDLATGTAADAEGILANFLPRAFRRPVAAAGIAPYIERVAALMSSGRSFADALRWAITAALCSADFLFLEEPAIADRGEIDDFALASRLSYFLWSSMPDAELTALAASGKLRESATLRAQVKRLLGSPKARAFTQNFAHQWLDLRDIDATSPDTKLFPEFDDYLKSSMVRESEVFFETMLAGNRNIRDFIDSDWVTVNERLARHYEIDGVKGEAFREVKLPPASPRGGIMTQASVLKITANGANTSPVTRGVWILEKLMGIHPPPPPPSVSAVVPDVTGAKTLRQLLDAHRNEERCNSCHQIIDPPGFALESFDPVGAWRTRYAFQGSKKMLPVDATGVTDKGETFRNVRDYKKLILQETDQVTHGLADKLLTYATGRAMGFSDRKELDAIVAQSAVTGGGFRDLIHAVVQSAIFHQP